MYDIKLYVHGVPNGQCAWGVEKLDSNYIDTFYGRKSKVPIQMFAEIRQFGSSTYSYYTYYVGGTRDCNGRSGGYFALTLRINYYYSDIRNIYNLLDASFNKFIIDSVVKAESGVFKYTIPDFSQVDAHLKKLMQETDRYMMQFSSDSDFVSLNGFKANGQQEALTLNLLECDAKVVTNHVKINSSISISPYHPTLREQRMINEKAAQIKAVTAQAQQEVADVKRNKEIEIQKIRNEYQDADKTISDLREEKKKADKEIARLGGTVNELDSRVKNSEAYKKKFEDSQKQLEGIKAVVAKFCDDFSGLSDPAVALGMSSKSSPDRVNGGEPKQKDEGFSFMKIIRVIHPFIDFFVMIALLVIIGFTLPKSCEGDKKAPDANEIIKQPEKQLENIQSKGANSPISATNIEADSGAVDEHQSTLNEKSPDAKNDVAGKSDTVS